MSGYCPDCGNTMCLCSMENTGSMGDLAEKYEELQTKNKELVKALEFTVHAAEYLYTRDMELSKSLCPTMYFTGTYFGDLELVKKTISARELLKAAKQGKETL